ncbi:MAG: PQQ-binding-like beta-propeller repeat protein [Planctomycetia bacterium]|nr:PQQ-binding-like beta-propeller repeat protein [Planctomycetia bacterium]
MSREQGLLQSWPKGGPTLLWQTRGAGRGYGSVAIAGDQLFALGDSPAETNDDAEYLVAFTRESGTPIWKQKVSRAWNEGEPSWQGARSTPTVDGNLVCVLGAHGDLVCCDAVTGQERWRRQLGKDFSGLKADSWGYSESVLIDEDRVVCTPGGPTATMVALNKNTGEVIWKCSRQADRGAGHASIVMARIGDTRVYLQTTGSGAMAVRAQDGKLLWTNTFDATIAVAPNPIVHGDLVFFSAGYGRGGALIQQVQQNDEIRATAVYGWRRELANKHGGVILMENCLFGDSDDRGLPFCADLKTGKLLWRSRGSGQGSVAMAGADGCLYLRFSDGTMTLAKAASSGYRETGSFRIPGSGELPSWSHPAIADARLFLREQDSILCYDLQRPDALADSSSD